MGLCDRPATEVHNFVLEATRCRSLNEVKNMLVLVVKTLVQLPAELVFKDNQSKKSSEGKNTVQYFFMFQ
jgi:hypothetical protein